MENACNPDGTKTNAYLLAELRLQPIIAEIYRQYDGKFDLPTIRHLIDSTSYNEMVNRERITRLKEKLSKEQEDGK